MKHISSPFQKNQFDLQNEWEKICDKIIRIGQKFWIVQQFKKCMVS